MNAPTAQVEPNEAGDGLIVRVFDTPSMEPMILVLSIDWSKAILSALMEHFQPEPGDPPVDLVDWSQGLVWELPDPTDHWKNLREAEEARDGAQFALAIAEEKIQGLERLHAATAGQADMLESTLNRERATVDLERRRVAAGDEQLQQVATQYNQLLDQIRAAQQEPLPPAGTICGQEGPMRVGLCNEPYGHREAIGTRHDNHQGESWE